MTYTARVWFRKGRYNSHLPIVEGYRAEIIDGLSDGTMVYTGACETREDAIAELIGHLKGRGLHGRLRLA
jgi:hypothetical protein